MRRTDPDEHATARPILDEEQEWTANQGGGGGMRRKVLRPDADCFAVPVDADDEPPIAAMLDSYDDTDDTDEAGA